MSDTRLNDLIRILDNYIDFIEPFKKFLDIHNISFLTDKHWLNEAIINQDLRLELETLIPNDLKHEINLVKIFNDSTQQIDSLLKSLFSKIKTLKSQWEDKVLINIDDFFKQHQVSDHSNEEFDTKFESMKKQNRFMNQKKVYEVDTMSIFVAKLCQHLQIGTIVDIGAGRAYLSTQLSSPVFDSFNVVAIDSKLKYVESSLSRLEVMKRKTSSFSDKAEASQAVNNFTTFNQFVQSSTKLNDLIEAQSNQSDTDFALVGLHSCGNLSNSIINLYLDNYSKKSTKKCKLLFNVACCYNLLFEKFSTDNPNEIEIDESSKFPMSDYLNNKKYALGFNMRMIACHNFERTLNSLEDYRELSNLNLWYRCVLQEILQSDLFKASDQKVGRKLFKDKSVPDNFIDYVRKALEKLGLDDKKISDQEIQNYWEKNLPFKAQFTLYIQFKMILAPIVEFIILLDRLIYLYEKNSSVFKNQHFNHYLIKIFDPLMSPRCHALVSFS